MIIAILMGIGNLSCLQIILKHIVINKFNLNCTEYTSFIFKLFLLIRLIIQFLVSFLFEEESKCQEGKCSQ